MQCCFIVELTVLLFVANIFWSHDLTKCSKQANAVSTAYKFGHGGVFWSPDKIMMNNMVILFLQNLMTFVTLRPWHDLSNPLTNLISAVPGAIIAIPWPVTFEYLYPLSLSLTLLPSLPPLHFCVCLEGEGGGLLRQGEGTEEVGGREEIGQPD